MLSLTKRTEYALIALCHLARSGTRVVSAREIATQHRVRLPLLMNVLKSMNQNGLLQSSRGAHGGYALAKPASAISLSTLILAVEGPVRLVSCAGPMRDSGRTCELLGNCAVRAPILRVHEELEKFLDAVSVEDIALSPHYGDEQAVSALRVLAT